MASLVVIEVERLLTLFSRSLNVSVKVKSLSVWFPVFKIVIVYTNVSPTPISLSESLSTAATVLVTVIDGFAFITVSTFSDVSDIVVEFALSTPLAVTIFLIPPKSAAFWFMVNFAI